MGHTVSSQRIVVDRIIAELIEYGRSLREEDREAFDKALAKLKIHIASISYVSSYQTWAFVLFSMILEQEKELGRIESYLDGFIQGR